MGKIKSHVFRAWHHLGAPLQVSDRRYKMRGYYGNRVATSPDSHEPHMKEPIRKALNAKPGAFIDVGVNVGQTFLKILELAPDRPYFGFEPQIECCHYLEEFICSNNLRDCHVFPVALGNRNGVADLFSSGAADEMATTLPFALEKPSSRGRKVLVRKGGELFAELGIEQISAIKIDVEGAELEVVQGMKDVIAALRPAIFFEVLPNFEGDNMEFLPKDARSARSSRAINLRDILTSCGYDLFNIHRSGVESEVDAFLLDDPSRYVSSDYVARAATGCMV